MEIKLVCVRSRDNIVDVVTVLRTLQQRNRDSIPDIDKVYISPLVYGPFNLLCGAYRGNFAEVRRPGREAIRSTPSRNDVKAEWHYSSTLPYDSQMCIRASVLL
jgi:hypothetical protein